MKTLIFREACVLLPYSAAESEATNFASPRPNSATKYIAGYESHDLTLVLTAVWGDNIQLQGLSHLWSVPWIK